MAKRNRSTFERLQRGEKLSRRERRQIERQLQAEELGWEIVHRNVAGIDVGNESHFVAVDARQADQPVREFGSWTAGLHQMADWLKTCQVQRVVLQTTGVYWIPVQDVLEKAGFEVAVVDARGTKNLPGRKSDVQRVPVDPEVGYLWIAAGLFSAARQYPFGSYQCLAFTATVGRGDGAFHPTNAESPDPNERTVSQCHCGSQWPDGDGHPASDRRRGAQYLDFGQATGSTHSGQRGRDCP